eukprot:10700629-Prorocentrum_lima.AAC.1
MNSSLPRAPATGEVELDYKRYLKQPNHSWDCTCIQRGTSSAYRLQYASDRSEGDLTFTSPA